MTGGPPITTDELQVTQELIDTFASLTGDNQWIHTDPERAKASSPFKATVAHGFLLLSLIPSMFKGSLDIENTTY